MSAPFATAGLGDIHGTGGDVDTVVSSQAWKFGYAAWWAGGEIAATGPTAESEAVGYVPPV